jgi:hypothetical protein
MLFESERGRGRKIFRSCLQMISACSLCLLLLAAGYKMTPPVASGKTGECAWAITGEAGNYTLTIDGDSFMGHYSAAHPAPWREYRDSITRLAIRDGVALIGDLAFGGCSGFTGSLTIPNSMTSIDAWTFWGCSGLTGSLTIGASVTSIGPGAFLNCSGFTGALTIPNSVTSISEVAFRGCAGFTGALTIGSSVTSIGNDAFAGCTGLTSVINLNPVPQAISGNVFKNVPVDTLTLKVPAGAVDAYRAAEGWKEFGSIVAIP